VIRYSQVPCWCPKCRPEPRLAVFAPRLARARDALVEQLRRERRERGRLRALVTKAERLVAHRELQLVRAYATAKGSYIKERQRKLRAAQRERASYEQRLGQLERSAWREAA
jgi:hypothetical protein